MNSFKIINSENLKNFEGLISDEENLPNLLKKKSFVNLNENYEEFLEENNYFFKNITSNQSICISPKNRKQKKE